MTLYKRSRPKSAAKKLLLGSIFLLSNGAGRSYAQTAPNTSDFTFVGSFQGHDYYVTKALDTWQGCESRAQSIGGHLVNIGSVEEDTFITDNVSGLAWIGYIRDPNTYVWYWSDNVSNSFTYWGSIGGTQQPDGSGGALDAALIHSGGVTPASGWDDASSSYQFQGVVELPSSAPPPTPGVPTVVIPTSNTLGYGFWKCEFDSSARQSTGYDPSSPSFLRNYWSSFKTCLLRSKTM